MRWSKAAKAFVLVQEPEPVGCQNSDRSYEWGDLQRIQVFISGTALASDNEHLPREVAQAKDTNGRSVVQTLVALDEPPDQVMVSTSGISLTLPD